MFFLANYLLGFSLTLVMFSFLAISFNSLFFTWVFMELNLMMVSPLLLMKSSFNKEQPSLALKYFLIQALGSIFILMTLTLNKHSETPPMLINTALTMAMMLKAGIPPLHFWFPPIVQMSNPYQGFILLCAQKIIPLFLIGSLASENILAFITAASIMGGLSGMNQNSVMKILAYSSMVHSGWMLSGLMANPLSAYFYFLVYTLVSWAILKFLQMFKIKFISEVVMAHKSVPLGLAFILIIFTLSGTPPFIGFFSKAYVIKSLMSYEFYLISAFLVVGSTLSFFFYTRLIISMSMFNFTSPKEKFFLSATNSFTMCFSLSVSVLMALWLIA